MCGWIEWEDKGRTWSAYNTELGNQIYSRSCLNVYVCGLIIFSEKHFVQFLETGGFSLSPNYAIITRIGFGRIFWYLLLCNEGHLSCLFGIINLLAASVGEWKVWFFISDFSNFIAQKHFLSMWIKTVRNQNISEHPHHDPSGRISVPLLSPPLLIYPIY